MYVIFDQCFIGVSVIGRIINFRNYYFLLRVCFVLHDTISVKLRFRTQIIFCCIQKYHYNEFILLLETTRSKQDTKNK